MDESALRRAVAAAAVATVEVGLNRGTSGNVSARLGGGFLVTPSGVPATAIRGEDVVFVDQAGAWAPELNPSSEWRIHRDIYRARADAHAVVHVHSPFAVSLACLRHDIPPFNYMVAVAGGKDIRCAAYATFGTQALSDHVLGALKGRTACLMANHGMIALGTSPSRAVALALEVETLCEQFWRASLMGQPVLLTDAEMDAVLERFRHYGEART